MSEEFIAYNKLEVQSTCQEFDEIDQSTIKFGYGLQKMLYFFPDSCRVNINTGQAGSGNMLLS
jgi:hypothetical protein